AAVLQVDPGAPLAVRVEAQLDLAGLGGVRLRDSVRVDLPGEDEPVGRLPGQYATPVAAEAVRADLVALAVDARLDTDPFQGVRAGPGELADPPGAQPFGEDLERAGCGDANAA